MMCERTKEWDAGSVMVKGNENEFGGRKQGICQA